MTNHDDAIEVSLPDWAETIDALVDGEPIGSDDLRRALTDPEACRYLVDALALRRVARSTVGDGKPQEFLHDRRWRFRQWAAAAALVLSATAGGYVAGRQGAVPASTDQPVTNEAVMTPRAPVPTTVIRLEPGVEWTEGGVGR